MSDGRACQDIRFGNCFQKFERGMCLFPRHENQTKAECCCSKGAAWGYRFCEVCPEEGEGRSQFLDNTMNVSSVYYFYSFY